MVRAEETGFAAVETYLLETLDQDERVRLKLLNPLNVALRLAATARRDRGLHRARQPGHRPYRRFVQTQQETLNEVRDELVVTEEALKRLRDELRPR
jgi:hypothetical protein